MALFLNKAVTVVITAVIGICIFAFITLLTVINKQSDVWFFGMSLFGLICLSYIYNAVNYVSGEGLNWIYRYIN
jgi:predicted membrane channel-forming protein YqfA (hemolysin III family)